MATAGLRARSGLGVGGMATCPRRPVRARLALEARAVLRPAARRSSASDASAAAAVAALTTTSLLIKGKDRRRTTATSASPSNTTTTPTAPAKTEAEEQRTAAISLLACLAAGAALGLTVGPADPALPTWAQLPSSMLGWSYTAMWTVSFYPQLITNYRRGKVDGLSLDYLALSAVGFASYTAYTSSLYLSDGVRQAYEAAHGGAAVDVQLADVVFAAHALFVTCLTAAQAAPAKARTEGQRLSPFAAGACLAAMGLVGGTWLQVRSTCAAAASSAAAAAAAAAVAAAAPAIPEAAAVAAAADNAAALSAADCVPLLDVVYALGVVKLLATLLKYFPQAAENHRRRSTTGWALEAVLLDTAGGVLSLSQVALDALARGDLSVVTGNPAKLGIGAISLAFDVVFLLQHYVWYRSSGGEVEARASASGGAALPALALARVPVPRQAQQQQQQRLAQPPPPLTSLAASSRPSPSSSRPVPRRTRASS